MPPFAMSSQPLRLELRSSHALALAVLILAMLAAWAIWRSALPRETVLVVPLLFAASWWRLKRSPGAVLLLRADGSAGISTRGIDDLQEASIEALHRRGPLWVLAIDTAGARHFQCFGPDTLDASQRRELLIWTQLHLQRRSKRQGQVAHV